MSDEDVLAVAFQEDRYVITSDRGFGDLVFVHRRPHAGVILFRLRDDWLSTKVARLLAVLDTVGIPPRKFVVITHEHIRIRSTELE
jgi:predicted nuclease of predicted toxin-antitoxin system